MSNDDKLRKLLQLLRTASEEKKIHWRTTPSESVFRADLPFGGVRIMKEGFIDEDVSPTTTFVLTLLDERDRTLEEWDSNTSEAEAADLIELFRFARRNALNLDQQFDRVIDGLEKLFKG